MQPKLEKRFNTQLVIIKATFCQPKKVGPNMGSEIVPNYYFWPLAWHTMFDYQCKNLLMSTRLLSCGKPLLPFRV
jgi:hypothetical protein